MRVAVFRASGLKRAAAGCFMMACGAALLCWPQGAATGVRRGLSVCGEIVIPSVLPFLIWIGVAVRSGAAGRVGRLLNRAVRVAFGLPGCCGAAVLMSLIGGYPAGAAAIRALLDKGDITPREARAAMRFCVNGGPAFFIGTVGVALLGNAYKGVLLYISSVLASLILGLWGRRKAPAPPPVDAGKPRRENWMEILVESVNSACSSLLGMCGFVLLFSAGLSLAEAAGFKSVLAYPFTLVSGDLSVAEGLFSAVWEVSNGCVELAGLPLGARQPLWLGLAVGWGGLSVHCQIGGMFSGRGVVDRGYFLARLWQGLLTAGIAWGLWQLPMPAGTAVSAAVVLGGKAVSVGRVSVTASAALLFLCGIFLFSAVSAENRLAFSAKSVYNKGKRQQKGNFNEI